MSYNIDSSEYLSGKLYIRPSKFREARLKYKDDTPEGNFLNDDHIADIVDSDNPEPIKNMRWYGEGSGRRFDDFKDILAMTTGEADIVLTWEGGDSITGLRVKDGVVTECDVKMTLVDRAEE